MKKLLSLLSVLTISGTAVPTTISASPYQKEEFLIREKRSSNTNVNRSSTRNRTTISSNTSSQDDGSESSTTRNSSISLNNQTRRNQNTRMGGVGQNHSFLNNENSQNKNNGSNLSRNSNNLSQITKKYLNKRNYLKNISSFLSDNSESTRRITSIGENHKRNCGNNSGTERSTNEDNQKVFRVYGINQNTGKKINYLKRNNATKYLSIPLEGSENKSITAILNTNNNLYLDGFISGSENNIIYWHFSDAKITNIGGVTSRQIPYSGDYNNIGNNRLSISKNSIIKSIDSLSDFNGQEPNNLKNSLLTTIFTTSEALRFFSVQSKVNELLSSNDESKNINWSDYENKLKNWSKNSENYIKTKTDGYPLDKNKRDNIDDIAILSYNSIPEQNN